MVRSQSKISSAETHLTKPKPTEQHTTRLPRRMGCAMNRSISERWWRRWAKWSCLWVLAWTFVLFIISGGQTYAPGGFLSAVWAVCFAMPILILATRWSLPRISHWANHTSNTDPWRQRRASIIAWIMRSAAFLRAIFGQIFLRLASSPKSDRLERMLASTASYIERLAGWPKALIGLRPGIRRLSSATGSAAVADKTVEVATGNAHEIAETTTTEDTRERSGVELSTGPQDRGRKGGAGRARESDKKKRRVTARRAATSSSKR